MKDHVALIVVDDGKTLFARRSKHKSTLPGIWAFASGTRKENEVIEETARREAMEELGIEVVPQKTIATHELPNLNTKLHFMICELSGGEPIIKDPQEIDKLLWATFDEFFNKFADDEIGHGLVWLRQNPGVWKSHNL